jgi:hypothetical protein
MPAETVPLRLPSVEAYIADLPQGWRSYPDCEASAELVASLKTTEALLGLEEVPVLGGHVKRLGSSEWIPEVVHVAILLALPDRRFPGPTGDAGFVAWMDKLKRAVLPDGAGLDVLEAVRAFPALWSSLHRGTSIEVIEVAENRACFGLVDPPALFPALARRWRRRVIETYLARAGASQPRAWEIAGPDDSARIAVTWR